MSTFKVALFDLDGTLLPMEMNRFLKAYLGNLASRFTALIRPERFVQELMAATGDMIENTDETKTNEEVFWESFFGRTGFDPDRMMPEIDHFYTSEFPKLREHTEPSPLARQVLEAATARDLKLVLATNPIFPRIAIEERMRWAGIDGLPFALITDYESMHFCKPRLQYYQEILDRIGARPQDCLMIGNDVAEDMIAAELGMSTYLVEDCLISGRGDLSHAHRRGRLSDLLEFLLKG